MIFYLKTQKKFPSAYQYLDVDSKILYNKEVTEIEWSKIPEETITLTCADGSTYEAENVIVTVSLGVLKDRHTTLFTPNLPDRKVLAIEKCGMGTLGKIFLKFDYPFWPANDPNFISYVFLWKDEDKQAIIGTDKEWLLGIMTFSKVDAFPELLEALYAGPLMSTFETIPDQTLIDDCMWLLEKFLGKTLPTPSYMQRTKWLTDANFLGAYSFISYASEEPLNDVTPADLAAPIKKYDGKSFLFFAGEATDIKFPSYAHGAVQSGYRAADEVIKAL
jgi:spermine oxidase